MREIEPKPGEPGGLTRAARMAGSYDALARRLEVSPNAVHNWRERRSVPPKHAIEMWRTFGVPLWEIAPEIYPREIFRHAA